MYSCSSLSFWCIDHGEFQVPCQAGLSLRHCQRKGLYEGMAMEIH